MSMNLPIQEDLKAILLLNRLGIEARRRALELFGEGRSPQEALASLGGLADEARKELDPEKELSLCWQKNISLLTVLDPEYPAALKEIPDPPLLLYMKGEIMESDKDAVAIVGTRHPSFYGRTQAKRFAGELAAKGLTIISGLARGIDQVAHEAALDIPYGRTVAVLGSGLDVIYPKENEKLYHRIAERGAVVSEYALGTPPLAENFPRRNRILSGLSIGVFVVEAHSRSGSLITAHQALEQGREVFALPGPVDQLTSRGTHQLLKEGAALAETPEDIFEALVVHLKRKDHLRLEMSGQADQRLALPFENAGRAPAEENTEGMPGLDCFLKVSNEPLSPQSSPSARRKSEGGGNEIQSNPSGAETKVIEEVLREEGPLGQDEILEFTGLEAACLPGLLLKLELTNKIQKTRDGKFAVKSIGGSRT